MATRVKDMTVGRPLPLLISFSLPLMLGNIFQQMYTVVDTMVVGNVLGVNALAALGATDWLYWMILGMIQGLTQGFGILMAREFGARNLENLRKVIGSSTILSLIGSGVLLVFSLSVARPILAIMNTPVQIMDQSLLYLKEVL